MNPTRIELRNVASFADLNLDLPTGCVALTGVNGAGKSTVMQAIEIALFGPRSRSLAPLLRLGEDDLEILLVFEHGGERYRVRRGFSGRGRGKTTLDFEGYSNAHDGEFDEGWVPLTQGNAADTQAVLERTIGLNRDTWLCSAYLAQGDGGAFTEAQPKDRKRILSAALALTLWDEAAVSVNADRRAAQAELAQTDGRIIALSDRLSQAEGLAGELQALQARLMVSDHAHAAAAENVTRLAADAERITAAGHEWRTAVAEHAAAKTAFDTATSALDAAVAASTLLDQARADVMRLAQLADEHAAKSAELAALEQQERARADAIRDRDALLADHGRIITERERIKTEIDSLGQQRDALTLRAEHLNDDPAEPCDRCGQPLDEQSRNQATKSLLDEASSLNERALALSARSGGELYRAEMEAKRAVDATVIPDPVEGLSDLRVRLAELAGAPADLASARQRVQTYETQAAGNTDEARTHVAALAAEAAAKQAVLDEIGEPEPGAEAHANSLLLNARAAEETARATRDATSRDVARVEVLIEAANADRETLDRARAEHDQQAARVADLSVLENAFGRDGVPAWIVEQHALPSIESEANRILTALGGPVTRVELRTERELKTGGTRDDALDIICATSDGDRDYATFSGGEKTRISIALRLALARLLAHRRDADIRLLCLDEPDGLDVAGTEALATILQGLVQDGVVDTTILASHDTNLRDRFDQSLRVERTDRGSVVIAE